MKYFRVTLICESAGCGKRESGIFTVSISIFIWRDCDDTKNSLSGNVSVRDSNWALPKCVPDRYRDHSEWYATDRTKQGDYLVSCFIHQYYMDLSIKWDSSLCESFIWSCILGFIWTDYGEALVVFQIGMQSRCQNDISCLTGAVARSTFQLCSGFGLL
jgi:hypothetical protein